MKTRILSCAELETAEAVDYYHEQRPGLGFEFAAELKRTLARIRAFPEAWPRFSGKTRRCILNRFPYGVLYQLRSDGILVLGVMHMSQDPLRWEETLGARSGEPDAADNS